MNEFREHKIEWDDEKVSRLWSFYSKNYPYNEMYFTKVFGKDILKRTKKIIKSFDDKVVLDFGCGPAFFIDHMVDLCINPKKYIGLDFSKDSVSIVDRKEVRSFEKEGILVRSMPSPVKEGSVDVCFLIEVLEHLNEIYLENTLKEIHRLLKVGGKLIITTPNSEDLDFSNNFCPECGCIYHRFQHVRTWTKSSLEQKLRLFSFTKVDIVETNFLPGNSMIKDLFIKLRDMLKGNRASLFAIFKKII